MKTNAVSNTCICIHRLKPEKKKTCIIQRAEQSRLPLSTKASMECDLIVWEFFGANWTNHLKFER